MHTTQINDTCFIHDGDYCGDVEIRQARFPGLRIKIPFDDLQKFVAEYVRQEKIAEIENADAHKLLGL